jgi:hypothetical protein
MVLVAEALAVIAMPTTTVRVIRLVTRLVVSFQRIVPDPPILLERISTVRGSRIGRVPP